MSGPRYQFAPGVLRSTEDPLEGEPRWDAIKRRLGFYNFETSDIDWFRIPGPGENENYVPEHEWDGSKLRFREPDGSWGGYTDVGLINVEVTNDTGTPSMRFTTANGQFEVPVEIKLLDDNPNNPVNQSLIGLYFHLQKFLTLYDALETIERVGDSIDHIDVLAANMDVLETVFGERVTIQEAVAAIPIFEQALAEKAEIVAASEQAFLSAERSLQYSHDSQDAASLAEQHHVAVTALHSDVQVMKNTLLDSISAEGEGVPYDVPASSSYDPNTKKLLIKIPEAKPPEFSEIIGVPALVRNILVPAGINATEPDEEGVVTLTFSTGMGLITQVQVDKLGNIAPGATKNQTDAYLLSRSNHTGLQPVDTIDGLDDVLAELQSQSEQISRKGQADGYASLDSAGKVPIDQIPESILGALNYQGNWNASTNTPTIPLAAPENKGWYYIVETAGNTSIDGITDWDIGDWLISNGEVWGQVKGTDSVTSVAGKRGDVLLAGEDITSGTVADARLPVNMGAKSFADSTTIVGASAQQKINATSGNAHLIYQIDAVNRAFAYYDRANSRHVVRLLAADGDPAKNKEYTFRESDGQFTVPAVLSVGSFGVFGNNVVVNNANAGFYAQSAAGKARGRLYATADGYASVSVFDTTGANPRDLTLDYDNWSMTWGGKTISAGFKVPNAVVASRTDVSKHIDLWGGNYGLSVSDNSLNLISGGTTMRFHTGGVERASMNASNLVLGIDPYISKPYPMINFYYAGVHHWRQYVNNDGSFILGNGDSGTIYTRLYSDGNVWTPMFGFLSNYVASYGMQFVGRVAPGSAAAASIGAIPSDAKRITISCNITTASSTSLWLRTGHSVWQESGYTGSYSQHISGQIGGGATAADRFQFAGRSSTLHQFVITLTRGNPNENIWFARSEADRGAGFQWFNGVVNMGGTLISLLFSNEANVAMTGAVDVYVER